VQRGKQVDAEVRASRPPMVGAQCVTALCAQRVQFAAELEQLRAAAASAAEAEATIPRKAAHAEADGGLGAGAAGGDLAADVQALLAANEELRAQAASLSDEKDHAVSLLHRERAERAHERGMLAAGAEAAPALDVVSDEREAALARALEARTEELRRARIALQEAEAETRAAREDVDSAQVIPPAGSASASSLCCACRSLRSTRQTRAPAAPALRFVHVHRSASARSLHRPALSGVRARCRLHGWAPSWRSSGLSATS
jgi:hypothetical protein